MAATTVALRTEGTTETVTQFQSLVLMRNLLRASLSQICYLRNIFPEGVFRDKDLQGINIKALTSEHHESKLLISWLERGVFDALQRGYLERAQFNIYLGPVSDDMKLLETYDFDILYPTLVDPKSKEAAGGEVGMCPGITFRAKSSKGPGPPFITKENIRNSTKTLLRSLVTVASTFPPLPADRLLEMRLYYTEATPADYEPEFFTLAEDEGAPAAFMGPITKMRIGAVDTPFHSFAIQLKSAADCLEEECPYPEGAEKCKSRGTHDSVADISNKLADMSATQTQPSKGSTPGDMAENTFHTIRNFIRSRAIQPTVAEISRHFPKLMKSQIGEYLGRLFAEGSIQKRPNNTFFVPDIEKENTSALKKENPPGNAVKEASDLYQRACFFVLKKETVRAGEVAEALGLPHPSTVVRHLMTRMEEDGFLCRATKKRLGREVIHNEFTQSVLENLGGSPPPHTSPQEGSSASAGREVLRPLFVQNLQNRRIYAPSPLTAHQGGNSNTVHPGGSEGDLPFPPRRIQSQRTTDLAHEPRKRLSLRLKRKPDAPTNTKEVSQANRSKRMRKASRSEPIHQVTTRARASRKI